MIGRRARNESGITIPMVAIAMVALLGMVALVIDIGNGWWTRRSLIQATDSAALAAAQDYVNGDDADACDVTAPRYVTDNEPAAVMTDCTNPPFYYPGGQQGRVSVSADHNVETWFAGVVGIGDYTVSSTTTAVWGPPANVTGIRPIGLCIDTHPDLRDFIENPPDSPVIFQTIYNKEQPSECGDDIPGDWGLIDFSNNNVSANIIIDWIYDGYPGEVIWGNHDVASCVNEPHCYEGRTGAPAFQYEDALQYLVDSEIYFTIPVFNHAEGAGTWAQYHVMGILRVKLLGFNVVGNQNDRWFRFEVLPGLVRGTCCGGGGGASDNKVIAICGVDRNEFSACEPNP